MALTRQQIKLVNKKFNFLRLLKAAGVEVWRVPSPVRCIFHDDSSKSAKVFHDGLWCWVCQKRFGSYDLMRFMGYTDGSILLSLAKTDMTYEEEEKVASIDIDAAKLQRAKFIQKTLTFDQYMTQLRDLYGEENTG